MTQLEAFKKHIEENNLKPKKVSPRFPFHDYEEGAMIAYETYVPKYDKTFYVCFGSEGMLVAKNEVIERP